MFITGYNVDAQEAYKITYDFKRGGIKDVQEQLIFNDSICFSAFFDGQSNIENMFTSIGSKKMLPHSLIHYVSGGKTYYVRFWPYYVSKGFLVLDKIPVANWVISDSVKYFKGYRCQEAYSLLTYDDTLFVFFTTDIPYPFGPSQVNGLPGVVVESYNQKMDHYYIATKIEQVQFPMQFPAGQLVVSRKKYNKRWWAEKN